MRAAERLPAQRVSAEVRSLLEGNTDFPTSDGLRNGLREAQDDQRNSQLRRPVAPAAVQMHALKKPPPQLYKGGSALQTHSGTYFTQSAPDFYFPETSLCLLHMAKRPQEEHKKRCLEEMLGGYIHSDAPQMHPGTPFNPSAQQRARCDNCLCSDNELYEWPTAHAA